MDQYRQLFETWYVNNRKVETDHNGYPPIGYISNHTILSRNSNTGRYTYLNPSRCWDAFSYRVALGKVDNERQQFEQWYRNVQLKLNGEQYVEKHWNQLIEHNGYRYVSDIVKDCAGAWSHVVLLDKQGLLL